MYLTDWQYKQMNFPIGLINLIRKELGDLGEELKEEQTKLEIDKVNVDEREQTDLDQSSGNISTSSSMVLKNGPCFFFKGESALKVYNPVAQTFQYSGLAEIDFNNWIMM